MLEKGKFYYKKLIEIEHARDFSHNYVAIITYSGTSSSRYAPIIKRFGISPSNTMLFNRSNVAVSLHCKSSMNKIVPFKFEQIIFNNRLIA